MEAFDTMIVIYCVFFSSSTVDRNEYTKCTMVMLCLHHIYTLELSFLWHVNVYISDEMVFLFFAYNFIYKTWTMTTAIRISLTPTRWYPKDRRSSLLKVYEIYEFFYLSIYLKVYEIYEKT